MLRLLLALGLLAAGLAAAGAQAAGRLQTGLAEPYAYVGANADLAFARTRAAGATVVRLPLPWDAVGRNRPQDPTNPADPAYQWQLYDRQIRAAAAHGLQVLLAVAGAPAWAQGKPKGADRPDAVDPRFRGPFRPNAVEYGKFARAAARRYSGSFGGLPRVRYWLAWGEPNVTDNLMPQFVGPKPASPGIYRGLLNSFTAAVHSVRRDNVVVAGGLSPFTVRNRITVTVAPLRFMRELLCMSKGRAPSPTCSRRSQLDVWAHHPYTSGGPTRQAFNPDDVSLGDLPGMRRLLLAAVKARRVVSRQPMRFWVTEFSWDTKPPDGHPRALPVGLHARWVSEALYRMWRTGVSLVTWYQLRDQPYPQSPFQGGLYFQSGASLLRDRAKPALVAFRFPFVALRDRRGTLVWGRTPDERPAQVLIEQSSGRGWKRRAVLRANRYGIFSRRLTGRAASSPSGTLRRATIAPRSYSSVVLGDSPSSYWRLGETSGVIVKDERGASHRVVSGGVRRGVPGALVGDRDRALALDGKSGRVRLGTIRSPKTVELWLRTAVSKTAAAFSNRNAISHFTFLGAVTSGNAFAFDSLGLLGSRWVTDNRWHHLAYTYDGALARLYVDGILDATATGGRIEGGAEASIGYDASLRTFLNGSVDEVAVYDYPLSAAQVKAHFGASRRKPSSSAQFQQVGKGVHLRARLANGSAVSIPFALARPPDRFVLPFGGGGG